MSCYDFSTLYTTIPHEKLKKKDLFEMMDLRFKGGNKQFKAVRKYGAR